MEWTLNVTVALYMAGLLNSLVGFIRKKQPFINLALILVGCGYVVHTAFLVLLGVERRRFSITSLPESFCFLAWCITLTFIVAYFRYKINVLGAFVLPLVSSLMILSGIIWEENHSIPPSLQSRWIYFHTSVAFLAYAAFFLTFVSGILYLIQEKELKSKRFRFLYFRLPSLQVCDELLQFSLFAGFILMSLTIVTGAFWAQQAWGRFWSWDPKETTSLLTWAIYLVLIHYRLSAGWRGRRAAYISIVGFLSALLTFSVSWFKGLHTYL